MLEGDLAAEAPWGLGKPGYVASTRRGTQPFLYRPGHRL